MVRIIAGTALAVGLKRLKPTCYVEIFNSGDRSFGGDTLQPHALTLEDVYY